MSKILVTGGNGYIGKYVVKELLSEGHNVIVSDIDKTGLPDGAEFTDVPIFSGDKDIYKKTGSPDVCIHLAWKDGFVHNSPAHMANLSSHITFCEDMMAGGLPILSCMGTMHEVGYWEGAIDENTPCAPQSQYGIAKNAMRQSLMLTAEKSSCVLNWLRAYYIVCDEEKGNSIFAKLIQAEKKGQEKFPFTSGRNLYDFIDIRELARLISAASLQTKINGIINVCTGEPESLGSCIERFIKEHDMKIRLAYGEYPDRPYDSPGVWGNADKIKQIMMER